MWDNTLDILQAHKLIHKTVVPNLLNARITVKIQLKLIRWQHHLSTYLDKQIPDLIKFGLPLDFDRNFPLQAMHENHASAKQYGDHIEQHIHKFTISSSCLAIDDKGYAKL